MSPEFNSNDSRRKATTLLYCGVVAGPVFTVVAVIEMMTRSGFALGRHDLSLLSNGSLGWIQISNFILAGVLTIAAALGMRRVLRSGRGSTWAPILIAIYGLGYIGVGVFVAASFPFARRFSGLRRRGWMAYSLATGIVVLAAVIGISSGSQSAATIIGFFVADTVGWAWLSALSVRLVGRSQGVGLGHS